MLPPDQKTSLNILEETTVIKHNRVDTSVLWKCDVPHLPANRKKAINSLESLKRRFQKNPDSANFYHDQIKEYIGHARYVSKEEAEINIEITNYIPITKF